MRARRRLFHANVFDTFPPHGITCPAEASSRGGAPAWTTRRARERSAIRDRTLRLRPPRSTGRDERGTRERGHMLRSIHGVELIVREVRRALSSAGSACRTHGTLSGGNDFWLTNRLSPAANFCIVVVAARPSSQRTIGS